MLSNIEQTRPINALTMLRFLEDFMEPHKKWRFEAFNPRTSSEWVPLFEISEEELPASLRLKDELNEINSPVVLRIVRT